MKQREGTNKSESEKEREREWVSEREGETDVAVAQIYLPFGSKVLMWSFGFMKGASLLHDIYNYNWKITIKYLQVILP